MALIRFLLSAIAAYLLAVFVLSFIYLTVPPDSTVMMGSFLRGDGMQRQWVPLARIAPAMRLAAIAGEDGRFCEHHGIDW